MSIQGNAAQTSVQVVDYALQIAYGVQHLHQRHVAHRDLNPSTIVVDSEGRLKINDFRTAQDVRVKGEMMKAVTSAG